MIIDTPGLDDSSELGAQGIEKTTQVLQKTNIMIIVVDIMAGFSDFEKDLLNRRNRIERINSILNQAK